jgi:hypothetical protein
MKKILTNLVLICSVAIFFTSCVSTNKEFQSGIIKALDVPAFDPEDAKNRLLNSRPDLEPANGSVLKGKPEICEFLNWAYLNYNDKFQYYFNLDIISPSTKETQKEKFWVKGIHGGLTAPDPSKAVGSFLCDIWFNSINQNIPKFGYPDFLSHPLMKNLWDQYGTLYSDFKK